MSDTDPPDTIPENELPVATVEEPGIIDQPGLTALSNLIDSHLGEFLRRQEKRDEEFRSLVVDTLNEAMINRDQMNKLEDRVDDIDARLRALEKLSAQPHDAQ